MGLKEDIEKRRKDQLSKTERALEGEGEGMRRVPNTSDPNSAEAIARRKKAKKKVAKKKPKEKTGVGKPSFDTDAAIAKIQKQIDATTNADRIRILKARQKALRDNAG